MSAPQALIVAWLEVLRDLCCNGRYPALAEVAHSFHLGSLVPLVAWTLVDWIGIAHSLKWLLVCPECLNHASNNHRLRNKCSFGKSAHLGRRALSCSLRNTNMKDPIVRLQILHSSSYHKKMTHDHGLVTEMGGRWIYQISRLHFSVQNAVLMHKKPRNQNIDELLVASIQTRWRTATSH